ncbi:hypothetical protein LTS10_013336 [Elasticomyces elasticus]|nr:hypothetical protein LTS10_013336 [Elasticomyces elasticus]
MSQEITYRLLALSDEGISAHVKDATNHLEAWAEGLPVLYLHSNYDVREDAVVSQLEQWSLMNLLLGIETDPYQERWFLHGLEVLCRLQQVYEALPPKRR